MITTKDVEYMAGLARLELTAEEKKKSQKDLRAILGFIDKLKEVNIEGIEATTAVTSAANVMRQDESRFKTNQELAEKMLSQAPERQGNFLKVKSILNKN